MEPEKHNEVKWFALSDLPVNLSPHTKKDINEYLTKKNKICTKINFDKEHKKPAT